MVPTFWPKGIPPHNITLYKGCNQVALTRAFVVFFLFSRQSRDLVEWLADTMIPDEYIWPTLNHNPHLHAPGSYKGTRVVTLYKVRLNSATCIRWVGDIHLRDFRWKLLVLVLFSSRVKLREFPSDMPSLWDFLPPYRFEVHVYDHVTEHQFGWAIERGDICSRSNSVTCRALWPIGYTESHNGDENEN